MAITVAQLIQELNKFDHALPVQVTWEGQAKNIAAEDLFLWPTDGVSAEGERFLCIDADFGA